MLPVSTRMNRSVVTAFVAIGLLLTLGCQSSPDVEQDQQALAESEPQSDDEPVDPYEDPYAEGEESQSQADPQQPGQQQPGQQQPGQQQPQGQQQPGQQQPQGQQQPGQQQPGQPQAQDPPDIDDETLETFVDALVATAEREQEAQREMQQAESQQEARQIQEEAMADLQAKVEDAGLTLEEYMQIAQQIQYSPELQQEVEEELEERDEEHLLQQPEPGM